MKDYIEELVNKLEQAAENPGAVFGMLYPYIIVIILGVGIYYVNNLDNISRQSVPPILTDTTIIADLQVQQPVNIPPVNIMAVKNSNPELISEGEKLYKTNCASCHGDNGAGDGPASTGLKPPPRNFTSRDNWKNGTKLSEIYTTLQTGLPPSAMIAYDFLLPKQKFEIAHYIRSKFIPDPDNDTDSDLQKLDEKYNLSDGVELPAQIPVASAEFIVLQENKSAINKVDSAISSLKKYQTENGFSVFNKVISNQEIALIFLSKNTGWKQNENNFVNLVVNNVIQNGFNGAVFNLKNEEWSSLYSFMLKLI